MNIFPHQQTWAAGIQSQNYLAWVNMNGKCRELNPLVKPTNSWNVPHSVSSHCVGKSRYPQLISSILSTRLLSTNWTYNLEIFEMNRCIIKLSIHFSKCPKEPKNIIAGGSWNQRIIVSAQVIYIYTQHLCKVALQNIAFHWNRWVTYFVDSTQIWGQKNVFFSHQTSCRFSGALRLLVPG